MYNEKNGGKGTQIYKVVRDIVEKHLAVVVRA
jgi:hypothetical protein